MEDFTMTTFKNTMRWLKTWAFTLFALISVGNVLSMETPYNASLNTNYIQSEAINGLTQVRQYLENTTIAEDAITKTLEEQTSIFKDINTTIADVTPTITLTPNCYISFEEKNEKPRGETKRKILGINSGQNGLIDVNSITINAGRQNTFKVNSTVNDDTKNAAKKPAYSFNEHIENLIPGMPGHYFILKGEKAPDTKTCLHALKIISKINQYVSQGTYQKQDISKTITYPSSSGESSLVLFAQNVYNQAKTLRLLHFYKNELSKDNQLDNLSQRLPKEIIDKEANLVLLKKISLRLKSIYEILLKAQQQNSLVNPTIFNDLKESLAQWMIAFNDSNTFNDSAQAIIKQCDNWLPTIKWHGRIEDKSLEDKKSDYVPDNLYANGNISKEQIRYNPNLWLNQCSKKQVNGIIGQLHNEPCKIPVVKNLYINSPLMIDSFVLKHGIKTSWSDNSSRYELKGKIYILLPDGNNGWKKAFNKNTQQFFYIEKIFTCAITDNIYNDTYEVYHRGTEGANNIITQCYAQDQNQINHNWFIDNDIHALAQRLDPIIGQQSLSNKINNYNAKKHDEYNTYTDNFDNYVCNVDNSSLTIWMPPLSKVWTMEIVLEKPTKHNLI